jgi:hypothetical protein
MTEVLLLNTLPEAAGVIGAIQRIESRLPATVTASEVFNKSSSQYKTATLDIVDLTHTGTLKHLLASIQRTRQALEEASIAVRRKRAEREEKQRLLDDATGYEATVLEIDIDELGIQLLNTEAAARGAIRKLAYLIAQYDSVLASMGVEYLTEEDYEKDQERHHIMTAFSQALHAARARGGVIDEGNLIYLFHIGINGAVAQAEVSSLLQQEDALLRDGKAPTHAHTMAWLEAVADRFAGSSAQNAASRGLLMSDKTLYLDV